MQIAKKLCEQEGLTYINGYNDAAIIAGQGTAALEILEQVPGRIFKVEMVSHWPILGARCGRDCGARRRWWFDCWCALLDEL